MQADSREMEILLFSEFSSFQTARLPRRAAALRSFALAAGFLKGAMGATPLKSSVYRHLS